MDKTLWFLAISPPDEVEAKVRAIQHDIAARFGPRRILKMPVHITLEPPFRFSAEKGDDLVRLLETFFAKEECFTLELRNFGSFRQDVVFIEVAASLPLREMQSRLSIFLRAETGTIKGEPWQGGYTPHVTVANRDVDPTTHTRIWREFNARKFYAQFATTDICLLRHDRVDTADAAAEKKWITHTRFHLKDM